MLFFRAVKALETDLETAVATLICKRLTSPAGLAKLMKEPTPADIATARKAVTDLIDNFDGPSRSKLLASIVESGRIAPGRLMVTLDRKAVAKCLGASPGRIDPASVSSEATFTLRRRGIEAKLVLDDAAPATDHTLLRNVASGWKWFEEIKRGTSMQAIARRENLSQRRIARLVDLAFLAPDIIDAIVTGRQPVSLTSDGLIKSRHRPLWAEQRAMIAAL